MESPRPSPPWPEILKSWEARLPVKLGFYDLGGRLRPLVGPDFMNHHLPQCAHARSAHLATCKAFEGRAMADAKAQGGVSWKRCPFGVLELLFLIHSEHRLEGVLFVGAFQTEKISKTLKIFSEGMAPPGPQAGPDAHESWVAMFLPLVRSLGQALGAMPESSGKRRDAVLRFLNDRACDPDVSLGQLEKALRLSSSATRSYLQKEFTTGFSALVTEKRIERARMLLRYSDETLDAIAMRCGYEGARSFDKAFRRLHKMSPGRWRETSGGEGSV